MNARQLQLYGLLGRLPDTSAPITAETISITQYDGYLMEELILHLNQTEPVPAYLVRPAGTNPVPAVIYHHVHGGEYLIGKEELIQGWRCLASPPYAVELTQRGWAVLCVDAWNFGQRHRVSESDLFKEMLWKGRVLWGMMVYDALRSVDYLESRPDIDTTRIATLGMSMGSTLAWWLAALDDRIKVCVDICCQTDFDALLSEGGLDRHGLYYFVPDLLNHFTAAEINGLICPRPHLAVAGEEDPLTPAIGLDRIDSELTRLYAAAGASDAWKMQRYPCGHVELPEMRKEAIRWLEQWL